mmetsp:Transcript_8128/g.20174  ORF Transcript_8128/g.20174 Transcript_8128/m.20174 type:complete len:269 (+) Transcript_8128:411-1217(+)
MRMLIYSRKMSNPTAANSDIEITESMYCQNRICATSRCPPPAMDAMVDIFIAVGLAPTMSKHSGRRESVPGSKPVFNAARMRPRLHEGTMSSFEMITATMVRGGMSSLVPAVGPLDSCPPSTKRMRGMAPFPSSSIASIRKRRGASGSTSSPRSGGVTPTAIPSRLAAVGRLRAIQTPRAARQTCAMPRAAMLPPLPPLGAASTSAADPSITLLHWSDAYLAPPASGGAPPANGASIRGAIVHIRVLDAMFARKRYETQRLCASRSSW